jgi:hypothetical protein
VLGASSVDSCTVKFLCYMIAHAIIADLAITGYQEEAG